jgi:hypothetical protein
MGRASEWQVQGYLHSKEAGERVESSGREERTATLEEREVEVDIRILKMWRVWGVFLRVER